MGSPLKAPHPQLPVAIAGMLSRFSPFPQWKPQKALVNSRDIFAAVYCRRGCLDLRPSFSDHLYERPLPWNKHRNRSKKNVHIPTVKRISLQIIQHKNHKKLLAAPHTLSHRNNRSRTQAIAYLFLLKYSASIATMRVHLLFQGSRSVASTWSPAHLNVFA